MSNDLHDDETLFIGFDALVPPRDTSLHAVEQTRRLLLEPINLCESGIAENTAGRTSLIPASVSMSADAKRPSRVLTFALYSLTGTALIAAVLGVPFIGNHKSSEQTVLVNDSPRQRGSMAHVTDHGFEERDGIIQPEEIDDFPGTLVVDPFRPAISSGRDPVIETVADKPTGSDWKEKSVFTTHGWLPVSVIYSRNSRKIVVGGTDGRVVALEPSTLNELWTADVGGSCAAVTFTSDEKSILATFDGGVRILDAATGELGASLEEKDSRPTAVGVFPDELVNADQQHKLARHKIIFGNARGYFVKSWVEKGGGEHDLRQYDAGREDAHRSRGRSAGRGSCRSVSDYHRSHRRTDRHEYPLGVVGRELLTEWFRLSTARRA
jgi:hypothetical protein